MENTKSLQSENMFLSPSEVNQSHLDSVGLYVKHVFDSCITDLVVKLITFVDYAVVYLF